LSENWRDNAACKKLGTNIFFADTEHSSREATNKVNNAKQICSNCKVQVVCLSYALNKEIEFGIWGGFTGRERNSIKQIFNLEFFEESFLSEIVNKTIHMIKAQARRK
jgi:WhiB family redox-sensing transcriptional regulator